VKNYKAVRWVLYYTMGLNLLVAIAKLVAGYVAGSLSLVADGYNSLFDAATNVVGLVVMYVASRPPDLQHPYGHRKYETLSTISVSVFLFVTTIGLLQSAIARLRNPIMPTVDAWTFGASLLSFSVHLYVSIYEKRKGEELKSEFLVADATHTRADVWLSLSVLIGLIVVRMGYPIADPILTMLIAVVIAKGGIDIIGTSSRVLVDTAALDEERVRQVAQAVPGVETLHEIRSRGQEDDIHVDLHVRVREDMPIAQAHHVAHQVKRRLTEEIEGVQDVVVHIEPQQNSFNGKGLSERIREIARRIPDTAVHAVQVHDLQGELYVTLHLEVEHSLTVEQAHDLSSQLEDMLRSEVDDIADVDIHIEPAWPVERVSQVDDLTAQEIHAVLDEVAHEITQACNIAQVTVSRVEGQLLVTAHWECAPDLAVEQAHDWSSELERRVHARLPQVAQVVIHVEPLRDRGVDAHPGIASSTS
jgi:cation diffusion facilitator family transporter